MKLYTRAKKCLPTNQVSLDLLRLIDNKETLIITFLDVFVLVMKRAENCVSGLQWNNIGLTNDLAMLIMFTLRKFIEFINRRNGRREE